MKFTTRSGSVYEVDTVEKKIRRLSGTKDPSPRQGQDGDWCFYEDTTPIEVGSCVFIFWNKDVPLLKGTPDNGLFKPSTLTSEVVSTED